MIAEVEELRGAVLGSLLGGGIGDALGGIAERGRACLSDDTQLTLATCESIVAAGCVDPAHLADTFSRWFRERRLTGLGSATLKALRDLEAGSHWALSGARGEMAAGNGGAMRIAPLAFVGSANRQTIRDAVRITHHSDEAYIGALAVVLAMRGQWCSSVSDLLGGIASQLPDSRVRDRLREVADVRPIPDVIAAAAEFGSSGYVVDTVPLALTAAWHMVDGSFQKTLEQLIQVGGDTDTIAAIAGQIAGARIGADALPEELLTLLPERGMVETIASEFAASLAGRPTTRWS